MDSTIHTNAWFRDARFAFEDWQWAVANRDTSATYMVWVIGQYEREGMAVPVEVVAATQSPQDDGLDMQGRCDATPEQAARFDELAWQDEVRAGDTRLGYQAWLQHQIEAERDEVT